MKKLALAVMAAGALMAGAAQADSIRIATEGAYAPYNFKDAAGNLVGFEIDLANELCKRMNKECEIVEQAWDGIIPALTAKKYDAIMAGMSITDKRMKVISFSRNYVATPVRFAVPKGSSLEGFTAAIANITLDDLSADESAALDALRAALDGKTVGVQGSTTHENFMKEFMPGVDLKTYDTMDNMILDLQAGRIDAGYTAITYLKPIIEKSNDIVEIGPNMTGGPLGHGVGVGIRQEDNELRAAFSAAIDSMIADGSLSKLAIQWFELDTSPSE